MARICEGPTLAARKLGLASFSPGQRPDSICGATSDLGSHFGYLDGRLYLARPKVLSLQYLGRPPGG
jgi:hypothetical protein